MRAVQRKQPTRWNARAATAAGLLACAAAAGCRSNAHTDLYIDQMAAEIRVLEDQLYKCDYENEVLHEKLLRARARLDAAEVTEEEIERRHRSDDRPRIGPLDLDVTPEDLTPRDEAPDVELGVPEPPDIDPGAPPTPDIDLEGFAPPVIDDGEEVPSESSEELPVDEETAEELPPLSGKRVSISSGIHKLYSQPAGPAEKLAIDPLLSSGKASEEDGTPAGIRIVLKAFDSDDRPTEISESIRISLLDPAREGPEARLGLWTFSPAELEPLRREGSAELAIDLEWNERLPKGDTVVCFARLERDGEEGPVTDQILPIRNDQSLAGEDVWAPRGE